MDGRLRKSPAAEAIDVGVRMGIVLQFPSNEDRRRRSSAADMDRARRDWTVLAHYDRDAAASAMTEFYRLWFAAAERQGHFSQTRPSDSE
jgi:hypothetical protein